MQVILGPNITHFRFVGYAEPALQVITLVPTRLTYIVVKWPRDMALGEVVYFSRRPNIVNLSIVPDSVSKNRNQGYKSCINNRWAMINDRCTTGHHVI